MGNITLVDYRICHKGKKINETFDPSKLTLAEARTVGRTVNEGISNQNDRNDLVVAALEVRQGMSEIDSHHGKDEDDAKNEEWKQDTALQNAFKGVVQRFNSLPVSTLNQETLDGTDASKSEDGKSSGSTQADKTKPKSKDDKSEDSGEDKDTKKSGDEDDKSEDSDEGKTKQASGASLDDIAGLLKRHLDPVTAVLPRDKDDKYVPVASKEDLKSFANKSDLKGYASKEDLEALENRAKAYIDNNAGGSSYNYRVAGIAAAITFVIVFIVFLVPAGLTIINALLFAVIAAAILGLIAGAIATKSNSNK